jgi:capsular polysaccharide biosynthesis protein
MLPLISRLRNKWLGGVGLCDGASEIIELSPAADREQPAAISLPSEFDRVLSLQEETTPEIELRRLQRGAIHHAPTMAYRLDAAVLAQGSLYFNGGYQVIRGGSNLLLPRRQDRFSEMMLCTNNVIERYFGHWLNDGLVLEQLADQLSLPSITLKRKPWLHEPDYRKLSGLQAVQTEHAIVDRLWVVDDRGINHGWISRLKKLRERLQSAVSRTGPKCVMLTRGALGAPRHLVNSREVQEVLEKRGFAIIAPETEAAGDLINALASAEIVVVVEGSAQSHCTYAVPPGSTLLTIQPPTRFTAISKDRADAVGLNWAFVVADPRPQGFHLPIDRLIRTLDEISRITGI